MTTIYFVRHVQAMGNIQRIFQGAIDTDISPQGQIQCEDLSRYFKDIKLDCVYTSPLKRAVITAEAVALGSPIEKVEGIREIQAGVWESRSIDSLEVDYPAEFDAWQNHPWDFVVEGSESMAQVFERTGAALNEIVQKSKGQTIAVVSHGCALRSLIAHAQNFVITDLGKVGWVRNGGITKIVLE
ncbi:MAG: histidine phosphatase family protein, partial [Oscillospiraceae bacterium]|nr:histidine phosphatase family protein [Oscillospiraceae bacterium]